MFELLGVSFLFFACVAWLLIGRYPFLLPVGIRNCCVRFVSFVFNNLKAHADFWPERDAGLRKFEGKDAGCINDRSVVDDSLGVQTSNEGPIINYKVKLVAQIRNLARRGVQSNRVTSVAPLERRKHAKNKTARNLSAPPKSIIKEIKSRAVKEYPRDYSMQLYELREQTRSYLEINSYNNKSVPESVLLEIKSIAVKESPQDYSAQFYELKEQTRSYLKLNSYVNNAVPESVLMEIKSDAVKEFPRDYSMQLYEVEEQAKSYLKLAARS